MTHLYEMDTVILLTSPEGEEKLITNFESVKTSKKLNSRITDFSLSTAAFDETELMKFGIDSDVVIKKKSKTEEIELFRGKVSENPRSLDREYKIFEFAGFDLLSVTQSILINEYYEDEIITDIVKDLITKYGAPDFTLGTIEEVDYRLSIGFKDTHLFTCLEKLANTLNYTFSVNAAGELSFHSLRNFKSKKSIKNGDFFVGSSSFSFDKSNLVNRLTSYGGKSLSDDIEQYIRADGENHTFSLNYKPRASTSGKVEIYIDGIAQEVGASGLNESGVDVLVNFNEKNIKFIYADTGNEKILPSGSKIEAVYRAETPIIVKVTDEESVQKYGRREDVIKFKDISDKNQLRHQTRDHLEKYKKPLVVGSLSSWKNDWNVGELTKIEIETDNGYFINEWLQVTEKSISISQNGKTEISYKFEQKKQLNQVIKNLLERVEELEKNEGDEEVQKLRGVPDTLEITSNLSLHRGFNQGLYIGGTIGERL